MGDSDNQHAFGWAPVGARILREYSASQGLPAESAPTVRYAKTWMEIKALPVMQQLLSLAVQQMVMLHAVDTFPRGGLCQGDTLKESLRRYEKLWLPLVAQQQAVAGGPQGYSHLVPPLDIALLWHLHRLQPEAYAADCRELRTQSGAHPPVLHVSPRQAFAFSDGSDAAGASTAALWRKAYPSEQYWPPAAPGSQTAGFRSHLAADLAAVAVRVPVFTHQLLRAAYVSRPFLSRAVDRYAKFLLLRKHHLELQHPIPPLDIALVWTSHMSCSGLYAADCQQLLQRVFLDLPGAGASPWLERDVTGPWRFHWTDTQRAWLDEFEEPFVVPASGYVPLSSPHPAESMFSQSLLAAFEEGSSTKQPPWRAGAHALYLMWLQNPNLRLQQQYQAQHAAYLKQKAQFNADQAANPQPLQQQHMPPPPPQQQPPPPKQRKSGGGGLFACFGCGGADADDDAFDTQQQQQQQQQQWQQQQLQQQPQQQQPAGPAPPQVPAKVARLPDEALRKLAEGFGSYRNLPLTSSHPYFTQLIPRGPEAAADSPTEAGAEVEVFAAAAPTGSSSSTGGGSYMNGSAAARDARVSDQDMFSGDYEVAAAGGQPLMW